MEKLKNGSILYEDKLVPIKSIRYDHGMRCDVFVLDNNEGTLLDTRIYKNVSLVSDDNNIYGPFKATIIKMNES